MKFVSNPAWKVIEEVIADQRQQIAQYQARVDRLTEAVARKEQVPLIMPQAPHVAVYPRGDAPKILEPASGWYDTRRPEAPKTPKTGGIAQ